MSWAQYGQNLITIVIVMFWIWLVVSVITDLVMSKVRADRLAEAEARIRQLEWDNWGLQQTRNDLIWVKHDLTWEKSRRQTAEERADSLYQELIRTYGRIRTAPQDSSEGGAPAQMVAA